MIKTDDGGETWTGIAVEDQFLTDVSAVPGEIGMYVGIKISATSEGNFSTYTQDYGTSWTELDDSVQYTNVSMFSAECGWAGGFNWDENSGGIYKWVPLAPSDAPHFTSSPELEVVEFETYTYNVVTEDPNSLALTITAPTNPTWLTITDNGDGTATLTGTAPSISGVSEDFDVILNVSNGDFDANQSFTITVNTSNTAPYFTSTPSTVHVQNTPYTYDIVTADDEDDDLTIEATALPTWASFVDNGDGTGNITGTPATTSFLGFQVVLVVSDGMFDTTQDFRVQVNANEIVDFGFGNVEVYPNPATGFINIMNCQGAYYEIMDISGRVLADGTLNNSIEKVDLSEYANGNFFVRLYNGEKVYTVKIVKL